MVGYSWSIYLSILHSGVHELVWYISRVLYNASASTKLPVNCRMAWSNIGVFPVLHLHHLRCDARYVWA